MSASHSDAPNTHRRLVRLKALHILRRHVRQAEISRRLLLWLVEILNGVGHANFFEQRATEYSKAASRGSWDGADCVWAGFEALEEGRMQNAM